VVTTAFGGGAAPTPGTFAGNQEVTQASKLPAIFAVALFVAGVAAIPLATVFDSKIFFIVGYMLTPLAVFLTVAWDAMLQRAGSRDPWFAVNKKLSGFIRLLAIASLVPAVIHIWYISRWVGEIAVQQGWFA
jgi:hypothetical protein